MWVKWFVIHSPNLDEGGGGMAPSVEIAIPEPVFFSPSPKSDYTVSAIKIVQFCM